MISKRAALAVLAAIAASGQAHANVTVSTAATLNMNCSKGTCVPTATKAVLNANDLQNDLSQFGNVRVMTTGNGVEANNIVVDAAFASPDSTSLTLEAHKAITINAAVSIGSNVSELELQSDTLAASDTLSFGLKGHIGFGSVSDIFGINGGIFTLVNSVQGLAGAVATNPGGAYALANSYDASSDGTYSASPVRTVLSGTVEGLGNTISRLKIDDETDTYTGLFADIGNGGTVRNIGLIHASVTRGGSGGSYVGALVGLNEGSVLSSFAEGTVSGTYGSGGLVGINAGGTVSQSYAGNTVAGIDQCGGLVAYNYTGVILDSYASGTCSGNGESGGLIGENDAYVEDSFSTGAVSGGDVGGLVGVNVGYIALAYATGSATGSNAYAVGGLVGENEEPPEQLHSLYQSYSTGAVTGGRYLGGLIGYDNSVGLLVHNYWDTDTSGVTNRSDGAGNVANDPGIKGLTTAKFQSGLPRGFGKHWGENPKINDGFPYLVANPPPK